MWRGGGESRFARGVVARSRNKHPKHPRRSVCFQTHTSKSNEALFPLEDEYTQNSFSTKMSQSGHGFIHKEFFGSDKTMPEHYAAILVPRIHLKNAIGSGYLLVRLNAKDPLDPFS